MSLVGKPLSLLFLRQHQSEISQNKAQQQRNQPSASIGQRNFSLWPFRVFSMKLRRLMCFSWKKRLAVLVFEMQVDICILCLYI